MFRKMLILAAIVLPAAATAAPPSAFLRDAIEGNYSETVLGRLIQTRGASAQVRQFGSMLLSDHSKGLSQAQAIAARLRLHIAATMTPQAHHEEALLGRLRGRDFDREVRRYMIEDHEKDIAKFQSQVRSGDRATSGYAAATIPVLRQHLATARSIRA